MSKPKKKWRRLASKSAIIKWYSQQQQKKPCYASFNNSNVKGAALQRRHPAIATNANRAPPSFMQPLPSPQHWRDIYTRSTRCNVHAGTLVGDVTFFFLFGRSMSSHVMCCWHVNKRAKPWQSCSVKKKNRDTPWKENTGKKKNGNWIQTL